MDALRKHGLADLAAWFLDAARPLNILGAQILYMGQPFVSDNTSRSLSALANLLEQDEETGAFIDLLKGSPR